MGHTDESGVTLPPLHPRCRCAIMYNEVAAPKKPRGLAAGNIDTTTTEGSPPKLIGKLESVTEATIKKTLEHYEKQIVTAPIEHAVIVTAAGEIYHCTGDLNTLTTIEDLGEKLYGSYVTHNHPVGSDNDYSFSAKDRMLFEKYKLARLRGIDEKFVYELNLDPDFLDNEDDIVVGDEETFSNSHLMNIKLARFLKLGYRRWRR